MQQFETKARGLKPVNVRKSLIWSVALNNFFRQNLSRVVEISDFRGFLSDIFTFKGRSGLNDAKCWEKLPQG